MHPGRHAPVHPDKPAIIMGGGGEVITYAELDRRSLQLAQLLWSMGLRPGDKIAIFAENHPRYFEVFWAAMRSGLYLTPINRYLAAEEAAYLVNDSGSTVLITTAQLADRAAAMLPMIPGCPARLMIDGAVDGFDAYEPLVAAQAAEPLAVQLRGEVMLYSSGTTGRPKGIKRPLSGLEIDDPAVKGTSMLENLLLGMEADTVYLCPAPLYHSAALMWSAGVHELGGTLVVMEKFDEEHFLRLVERHRVTHSQVVPTMLVRMLRLPAEVRAGYDLSSLRCIVHSAAPCPVEVKRQAIEWLGPIVSEYYSGTEGSGLTFLTAAEWLEHPGSVGRSIIGIPHICSEEGDELPVGEAGLVYFERDAAPFEYHDDPDKTRNSRHPQHPNWTALGDVGYLDADGYLYLTDRKAFMIISGGVNIYPAEIEACLIMHPAVTDVAVFGLPDLEMGQYVHAVVQPAPGIEGSDALVEELRTYAREHLAGFKVPRRIDFRSELPRLPTGKLAKHQLRDDYLEAAR